MAWSAAEAAVLLLLLKSQGRLPKLRSAASSMLPCTLRAW
jgi:hypothetical protein